jgi:hypothetical protein
MQQRLYPNQRSLYPNPLDIGDAAPNLNDKYLSSIDELMDG